MPNPITPSQLAALCPDSPRYHAHLFPAMDTASITTPLRQAHFLAQIAVESAAFRRVRESLNYSVEGLLDVFGTLRISETDAARYGRAGSRPADQPSIANSVYGGEWGRRNLGNTEPGDGWAYIGRGLKQVTGRANYTELDAALGMAGRLVNGPELLERADLAVDSAVWFWTARNVAELADRGSTPAVVELVTRRINGGANGLRDRQQWFERFARALKVRP